MRRGGRSWRQRRRRRVKYAGRGNRRRVGAVVVARRRRRRVSAAFPAAAVGICARGRFPRFPIDAAERRRRVAVASGQLRHKGVEHLPHQLPVVGLNANLPAGRQCDNKLVHLAHRNPTILLCYCASMVMYRPVWWQGEREAGCRNRGRGKCPGSPMRRNAGQNPAPPSRCRPTPALALAR